MSEELPAADGSSPQRRSFKGEPPMSIDPAKRYTATMVTSKGSMTIALDPQAAPRTVNSFVFLARYHYFDGIVFHRVIPGFVLQGGDPTGTGTGGPGYKFADELPAPGRYELGSLAMANAGPDTNGSQFFLVYRNSLTLPASYTPFGQIVSGLGIIQKVAKAGTDNSNGNGDGHPKEKVTIESVTITKA